ncbi:ABC transporter substrate-binding protein [Halanaerobium sp. ST460_2HS_T2]|uniref:ABC transporter substrate-binding protein n=1 Tax=Halanaerobium sp. ST460_2HS_T2 TaxID=2183914 RepID=UPI000DF2939C|nr:ABC transporter substrate-binding protein [Halanaerobium sp. ST460_2HS_T2]RCW56266.1 NitT/TauT family transport system substrate-binding protein [Halanaerobium sp. ST460_2HS_T2]
MLKRKKLLTLILLLSIMVLAVLPAAAKEINIQAPTVPAALPFLWMQEKAELPEAVDLKINLSSDHQRGISLLAQNDIDFLITGSNLGANAYNRGIDLKMLNINTWGIDYLLTDGFKADNWQDLKGKDLVLPLQGGPLDFLARYLAAENGVDPETELNLVYRPLPGAAQLFMAGEFDAIILPEPLVTVSLAKRKSAEISMDIQKEWAKIHGDDRIPFVALFVNGKFASEYPQFTDIIDGYYKQGINWVNNNPEAAAQLASRHFGMPAPILKKSYSRINLNIYPDSESSELTELYFGEMLKMYPDLIGGSMPDEEFYY